MKLNDMQRAVLKDYANGEFAGFLDYEDNPMTNFDKEDFDTMGDGLLTFILIELGNKEDCENAHQGIDRMRRARDELDLCVELLEKLANELTSRGAVAAA